MEILGWSRFQWRLENRHHLCGPQVARMAMHQGHYVFAQLMQHLPLTTFRRCVARYNGEYRIQQFSCLDQYLCLAFAQLTWRESLRDIEACLRAQSSKLYHLGFRRRTQHLGQCQRGARLADLCRLRTTPDQHRAAPLCERSAGTGPRRDRLCVGFYHHRSLPLGVPLGAVPIHQGRRKASYTA